MLYQKNKSRKTLDPKLFQEPTAEYRATPFWAWNCELDREELLRQIDVFKEMGYGGYHIHVRSGLTTPYLSEEFMGLVKACVEHGKEKEMLTWLYDEDRWPSGFAGGFVTKEPEFRQRRLELVASEDQVKGRAPELIACYDVCLDQNGRLESYRRIGIDEPVKGIRRLAYQTQTVPTPRYNDQGYVDTLNPAAIERFIEITHEAYLREVGEEFGKAIPAIFTDEPQFVQKGTLPFAESDAFVMLPWTPDLEESYKATYGESLVEHIPELFWELREGVSPTRYRYHDHVAERFATAFADLCGAWCDSHGIMLTGHMMEEPTLQSQTHAVGDAMRSYRSFGIPGIDMLCNRYELTTAKQCQSAVRQYGREGMLSELDGVTGWDFDFRGHKLHGDWQAALGVTVRVPHLAWVSMKGEAKRDYPASISYQSSWHSEYRCIEDHFARVATALTRGVPMVRVAVVHPVESYWLHWGPTEQTAAERERLEANFANVTDWLLKGSIDFDYICESLFPSLTEQGGAPLRVGAMQYDAVIVPECETLRSTTLERLEAFQAAGGKLIFMGDPPRYENALPSDRGRSLWARAERISFNRSSLLEALAACRTVELRAKNGALTSRYVHQLRRDAEGVWLFIAPSQEPYNKDVRSCEDVTVTVKGEYFPELWDTQTGEIHSLPFVHKNGNTVLSVTLYTYDSALLFLSDRMSERPLLEEKRVVANEWNCVPTEVAFSLTEPNVLMLDQAKFAADGGALQEREEVLRIGRRLRRELGYPPSEDAQPWVVQESSAKHTATLEFEFFSEIGYAGAELALEDADRAQILFNGNEVKYVDSGYYTDRSIRKLPLPEIQKGRNVLSITIPFGKRDNIERVFVLGDFGVRLIGRKAVLAELPQVLAFDDLTRQLLPFYGGTVKYRLPLKVEEAGDYLLRVPHFRAAVLGVSVDGKRVDTIAFDPYEAVLSGLSAGQHEVTIEAFLSRQNSFGHVHCADGVLEWIGPSAWRTSGSSWTYEYRLSASGILTTPLLFKL